MLILMCVGHGDCGEVLVVKQTDHIDTPGFVNIVTGKNERFARVTDNRHVRSAVDIATVAHAFNNSRINFSLPFDLWHDSNWNFAFDMTHQAHRSLVMAAQYPEGAVIEADSWSRHRRVVDAWPGERP